MRQSGSPLQGLYTTEREREYCACSEREHENGERENAFGVAEPYERFLWNDQIGSWLYSQGVGWFSYLAVFSEGKIGIWIAKTEKGQKLKEFKPWLTLGAYG